MYAWQMFKQHIATAYQRCIGAARWVSTRLFGIRHEAAASTDSSQHDNPCGFCQRHSAAINTVIAMLILIAGLFWLWNLGFAPYLFATTSAKAILTMLGIDRVAFGFYIWLARAVKVALCLAKTTLTSAILACIGKLAGYDYKQPRRTPPAAPPSYVPHWRLSQPLLMAA